MSDRKIEVTPVECPTLSPERQLLWRAAEIMQLRGKTCGPVPDGIGPHGEVCALRAIGYAAEGAIDSYWPALHRLQRHIGCMLIHPWSDTSDQATVVAALRSAALS